MVDYSRPRVQYEKTSKKSIFQKKYFLSGDESKIKPMILKDIAEKINMDISTISRVANSKYVDTPYGIKLIKSFFSEGIKNSKGEEISTIEVKKSLEEIIFNEDKKEAFMHLILDFALPDVYCNTG